MSTTINSSLDYPKQVTIETVAICNAHCDFCPHEKLARRGAVMEMRLIEKVVSELVQFPADFPLEIALNGVNEPLADKRLFDILDIISHALPNAKIYFVTNGNLLDEKVIATLSKYNLSKLCISLNFYDRETYKKRMGLEWDKTLAAINILHAKTLSGEFTHPVHISRVQDRSEADSFFTRWVEKNYPAFKPWLKKAGDWLGAIPRFRCENGNAMNRCHQWKTMHIASNGIVQHCCMDALIQFPWGDVKHKNLIEIYNQKEWHALREGEKNRFEIQPCSRCTYY